MDLVMKTKHWQRFALQIYKQQYLQKQSGLTVPKKQVSVKYMKTISTTQYFI